MTATRDRYGEPLDVEDDDQPVAHRCDAGWLSNPDDDVARPCLTCRPHLAGRSTALQRQLAGTTR